MKSLMSKTDYANVEDIANGLVLDANLQTIWQPLYDDMNKSANMINSKFQWMKKDKDRLDSQNRPANSYNLISPLFKVITGVERGSRKKLQVTGRTSGDYEDARFLTQLLDFEMTRAKWDNIKSKAFDYALLMKIAYVMSGWRYNNESPNGEFFLDVVDPRLMAFDTANVDDEFRKVRFMRRLSWLSVEDILDTYSLQDIDLFDLIMDKSEIYRTKTSSSSKRGVIDTMLGSMWNAMGDVLSTDGNREHRGDPSAFLDSWYNASRRLFAVMEFSERIQTRYVSAFHTDKNEEFDITSQVMPDDGSTKLYDRSKTDFYLQQNPMAKIEVQVANRIWVSTIVPALGLKVYDQPMALQNKNFKYTPLFCYNFHPDISKMQSFVDELIDPQTDYNKRRSTILEIIMRTSALGIVVEEGALDGFEEEWENKTPGAVRHINHGYWDKWKNDEAQRMSPDMWRDQEESKLLHEEISGITKAARGQQESSQETGKLFAMKRDQAEVMMRYLFDNLDTFSLQVGRNCIDYIQTYMTESEEIRILDDEDNPYWLTINEKTLKGLINNPTIGKYDCEISTTPHGSTAREIEYLKLLDFVKFVGEIFPQGVPLLLPILAKASDSPYRTEIMVAIKKISGMSDVQQQQEMLADFIETQRVMTEAKLGNENAQLEQGAKQLEQGSKQVDFEKKQYGLQKQKSEDALYEATDSILNNTIGN